MKRVVNTYEESKSQREIEYRRYKKANYQTPIRKEEKPHSIYRNGMVVFSSDSRLEAMEYLFQNSGRIPYDTAMREGWGYSSHGRPVHGDCGDKDGSKV